jgi:hypothetical protein
MSENDFTSTSSCQEPIENETDLLTDDLQIYQCDICEQETFYAGWKNLQRHKREFHEERGKHQFFLKVKDFDENEEEVEEKDQRTVCHFPPFCPLTISC